MYVKSEKEKIRHRAAGPYEDTRTGPSQVLRPNKVPRTGPNQVFDIHCGLIFSVHSGRGVKIWLVLTMF